jgi:hypothetical protein
VFPLDSIMYLMYEGKGFAFNQENQALCTSMLVALIVELLGHDS